MEHETEEILPERTCIVTRQGGDESNLIRFARAPDGKVVPDIKRKLPGRGVWVGLKRQLVAEAAAKGLFSRGFGTKSEAEPDLADQVGRLLRSSALSYISLAKKAGHAVAGFDKVEAMAKSGEVALMLHAVEAAPDGCRKLDRLVQLPGEIVKIFTLDELDLAFGRSNVIHAAIKKGPLAQQLVLAVRRNQMYEAG